MMKKILFIFLYITTLLFANNQPYSVIIHKPFNAKLLDITQDYDRSISAVGFSKNFQQHATTQKSFTNAFDYLQSISSRYGSQMHLIKLDQNNATLLLSKTANLSKFNQAVSLVKTPTNGYFIGGFTMDGSLLIAHLDSEAHLISSITFGTKNFDRMSKLISLSDGGVLAVGSSTTSRNTQDPMFNTGLGNNDIFLTRFDKNLHKLWSKKYGSQYDDMGIDAAEASDGSLVIIGTRSYEKHRDVSLMRISENGDRIWMKYYQQKHTVLPTRLIHLRDDTFLAALNDYNTQGKAQIRLIKFDLYQNIFIDTTLSLKNSATIHDIAEFSNGNFVAVGSMQHASNTDGLALVLNHSLQKIKKQTYGGNNYDHFYALAILNNSQVAVAGVHTDATSQETNMWVLKLNRDLSMASIKNDLRVAQNKNFYEMLCKLFAHEIRNKQLSISKDLHIKLLSPALYFRTAEAHLTQKQKDFLKGFAEKLLNFLYQHKEMIQALSINGHTSSLWQHASQEQKYLKNAKLSQARAYNTLAYIFHLQKPKIQQWLTHTLHTRGYAYTQRIMHNNKEDVKHSRRVEFQIILR